MPPARIGFNGNLLDPKPLRNLGRNGCEPAGAKVDRRVLKAVAAGGAYS